MFRIHIDPHRHISQALESAVLGWLMNDVLDVLYDDKLEKLVYDESRLAPLIDRLDNRFWCALDEAGIEFVDDCPREQEN